MADAPAAAPADSVFLSAAQHADLEALKRQLAAVCRAAGAPPDAPDAGAGAGSSGEAPKACGSNALIERYKRLVEWATRALRAAKLLREALGGYGGLSHEKRANLLATLANPDDAECAGISALREDELANETAVKKWVEQLKVRRTQWRYLIGTEDNRIKELFAGEQELLLAVCRLSVRDAIEPLAVHLRRAPGTADTPADVAKAKLAFVARLLREDPALPFASNAAVYARLWKLMIAFVLDNSKELDIISIPKAGKIRPSVFDFAAAKLFEEALAATGSLGLAQMYLAYLQKKCSSVAGSWEKTLRPLVPGLFKIHDKLLSRVGCHYQAAPLWVSAIHMRVAGDDTAGAARLVRLAQLLPLHGAVAALHECLKAIGHEALPVSLVRPLSPAQTAALEARKAFVRANKRLSRGAQPLSAPALVELHECWQREIARVEADFARLRPEDAADLWAAAIDPPSACMRKAFTKFSKFVNSLEPALALAARYADRLLALAAAGFPAPKYWSSGLARLKAALKYLMYANPRQPDGWQLLASIEQRSAAAAAPAPATAAAAAAATAAPSAAATADGAAAGAQAAINVYKLAAQVAAPGARGFAALASALAALEVAARGGLPDDARQTFTDAIARAAPAAAAGDADAARELEALWLEAAALERRLHQWKRAVQVFEAAVASRPVARRSGVWLAYAAFCAERHKPGNARRVFCRALVEVAESEQAGVWQAFLHFERQVAGNAAMTLELLRRLVDAHKDKPPPPKRPAAAAEAAAAAAAVVVPTAASAFAAFDARAQHAEPLAVDRSLLAPLTAAHGPAKLDATQLKALEDAQRILLLQHRAAAAAAAAAASPPPQPPSPGGAQRPAASGSAPSPPKSAVASPGDLMMRLSECMRDATIRQIVRSLEQLQALKVQELAARRGELLAAQQRDRDQLLLAHRAALAAATPATFHIYQTQHVSELQQQEQFFQHALLQFDAQAQKELDEKVSEQQAILQQAGVPGFFPTKDPDHVRLQAQILRMMLNIEKSMDTPQILPAHQPPPATGAASGFGFGR